MFSAITLPSWPTASAALPRARRWSSKPRRGPRACRRLTSSQSPDRRVLAVRWSPACHKVGLHSFRRRGLVQTRSNKRQKELARKERQRAKQERREERKREKETRGPRAEGEEDPDLAGIVPAQQPVGGDFRARRVLHPQIRRDPPEGRRALELGAESLAAQLVLQLERDQMPDR